MCVRACMRAHTKEQEKLYFSTPSQRLTKRAWRHMLKKREKKKGRIFYDADGIAENQKPVGAGVRMTSAEVRDLHLFGLFLMFIYISIKIGVYCA